VLSFSHSIGGGAPAARPAAIVAAAIEHLRTRLVSVARFDRYLAMGSLSNNGWVTFGPAVTSAAQQGSGYSNMLRVSSSEDYRSMLTMSALSDPNTFRDFE
jgi:hypothetical protein